MTEVKAENVEIIKARQEDLQSNLGDIRFTLYGKISKTNSYTEVKQIDDPDIVFDSVQEPTSKKPVSIPNTSGFFDGCFTSIGFLFALIPILGLLLFFFSIGWLPTLVILGIIIFFWFISTISNSNSSISNTGGCLTRIFTGIFSGGFILFIAWALIAFAMRTCDSESNQSRYQPPKPIIDEIEDISQEQIINNDESSSPQNNQDTTPIDNIETNMPIVDTLILHNRVWQDYRGDIHQMQLAVSKKEIRTSKQLRDRILFSNSFGEIYRDIAIANEDFMSRIYSSLDSLRLQKQMSEMVFAEAVVSMVQDISYKLILDTDCDWAGKESQFVKEYLSQCSEPCCLGNIKFGVQTPSEFMGNLYGDCDTRTLFLFTILNHYNYDVGILNSEALAHSILAINLPYSGQYKLYNNKRYYVWETTNVNLIPGYIDPQFDAMHLWDMVLTSK